MAKMLLSHLGLKTRTLPADSPKGIRRLNLISEPPHSPIFNQKRGPSAPFIFFATKAPLRLLLYQSLLPLFFCNSKNEFIPLATEWIQKTINKKADGH